MKISLAPVPYFWDLATVRQFYKNVEQLPVDIVYLGETVCSKRRKVRLQDWLEIAHDLEDAGKEVVLSTLALLEAESELAGLQLITGNGRYAVEANDIAAIQLLQKNAPIVIGPHINIYNDRALSFLCELGARRWVIPIELHQHTLADILARRPARMETEITGFGRLALAFSARCFSARACNLAKDDCGFECGRHPDGMLLETRDELPFLVINGIQLQSAKVQNLLNQVAELERCGIDVFRIVPWLEGMETAVTIIRQVLDRLMAADVAESKLAALQPYGQCNGYYYGQEGMEWLV